MNEAAPQESNTRPNEHQSMHLAEWLGDIPELEKFDRVIPLEEADELRRYFRVGGIESFGRSTVDAMLRRSERYAFGTRPCLLCGGYSPTSADDPLPERGGCGFVPSGSKRNREVTQKQREWLALLDLEGIAPPPMAADTPCPECECRGWVIAGKVDPGGGHLHGPITARPTGSSVPLGSASTNLDVDLHVLAVVGARLDRTREQLSCAPEVLSAYYEEDGGFLALWAMCPAGRKLLRRNRRDLPPVSYFESLRAAQKMNNDPTVWEQFQACEEQSRALLATAAAAWNAAMDSDKRAKLERILGDA